MCVCVLLFPCLSWGCEQRVAWQTLYTAREVQAAPLGALRRPLLFAPKCSTCHGALQTFSSFHVLATVTRTHTSPRSGCRE